MGFFSQNNYNYTYGGVPPFQNNYQQGMPFMNVATVDSGAAWFVATAPLFSLFLESVAGNKYASVFLWIFTYILCVVVCAWDKKNNLNKFYDTTPLGKIHFVPVAYLFKRDKVIRQNKFYGVVCVICTLIAFIQNGFVNYYLTTEDDYIVTVQTYKSAEILDFAEVDSITGKNVADTLYSYLNHDEVIWECEKGEEISFITAKAKTNYENHNADLEIVFKLEYDGFSFGGVSVEEVKIDGVALEDEKRSILLMQIFSKNNSETSDNKDYVEA